MTDYFYLFLAILLLIAAFLGEDFVLTFLYLLLGALLAGRWWSRTASRAVMVSRSFTPRAFFGESITVRLELTNRGWLPIVWMHLRESLPVELIFPTTYIRVFSLPAKGQASFEYSLEGRKRGLYSIGPLALDSGDLLGLIRQYRFIVAPDSLIVYPKIIPLTRLPILSQSPLGPLLYKQPVFEDPVRIRGKRDYIAGDSLRRVDWKASAVAGRLQVKIYEPSIALEATVFLNLLADDYEFRTRIDTTELAIVVAASIANWITSRRQAVGLVVNGADPLNGGATPAPILPHRGRSHLMRLLDVLARIGMSTKGAFASFLRREIVHFSWGTTLLVVTGRLDEALFNALFAARRSGLSVMLVVAGRGAVSSEQRRRAEYFGFPLTLIQEERDLDVWRQ